MPVTAPNTYGVAQAIQTLAQALSFPAIGGITGYNTVSIGAKKDVTNLLPLLEITGLDDETERASAAAVGNTLEVDDSQSFQLTTTVDYTDSTTGEQVVFKLRDVLTDKLHTSAKLNNTTGVIGVYVVTPGKYGYAMRNGVWCRMHQMKCRVSYWYEPTMGA